MEKANNRDKKLHVVVETVFDGKVVVSTHIQEKSHETLMTLLNYKKYRNVSVAEKGFNFHFFASKPEAKDFLEDVTKRTTEQPWELFGVVEYVSQAGQKEVPPRIINWSPTFVNELVDDLGFQSMSIKRDTHVFSFFTNLAEAQSCLDSITAPKH